MLVVRIELWPGGDESKARLLGLGTITNDGTGRPPEEGNYDVRLLKSPEYAKAENVPAEVGEAKPTQIWKRGRVDGFPRKRLGPWDLLFRALRATVLDRNR